MAIPESIKRADSALQEALAHADSAAHALYETHDDTCDHGERHWVSFHAHEIDVLTKAAHALIEALNRHFHQ